MYQKGTGLYYKCHNCNAGMSIGNFLQFTNGTLYKEYILERYKAGESGKSNYKKPTFNIPTPKFGKVEKPVFEHGEYCDKLPKGHYCLEYLDRRQIPKEFYSKMVYTDKYKTFVNAALPNNDKKLVDEARLVMLFFDEYNELIAISGRALENGDKTLRYITLRTKDSDSKLIFGLDHVDMKKRVKIVEGPIDSLFLDNCVASGDANLKITSKNIKSDEKTLIFDNEPRNKEIVKMMKDAINYGHDVVIWPDTIKQKDINEMIMSGYTKDELEKIISNNTFSGLEAQAKFTFWKKV